AAGRLDAFWELTLAPWDVAGGVVLVREAGGSVTTLEGSDDVLQHGSIVAGNPTMHRWLLDLVRSASVPAPLVECVPNFSEGHNSGTLDALEGAITAVPGVKLLDVQADPAHHRSVFTFVAPPDAALEAALRAVRVATERIDLTKHAGEHPRMGATDVVPFVPVRDVTMDDCVALARRLGERGA